MTKRSSGFRRREMKRRLEELELIEEKKTGKKTGRKKGDEEE